MVGLKSNLALLRQFERSLLVGDEPLRCSENAEPDGCKCIENGSDFAIGNNDGLCVARAHADDVEDISELQLSFQEQRAFIRIVSSSIFFCRVGIQVEVLEEKGIASTTDKHASRTNTN